VYSWSIDTTNITDIDIYNHSETYNHNNNDDNSEYTIDTGTDKNNNDTNGHQ